MIRAAIYIRVSSERQAIDKISPDAQEADCQEYCASRGYKVVGIYRDIKKYRAGGKLVEPSGTRADRPFLKQMLADARSGKFEVMIAWREDRLYRGYHPMLDVLDCMDETHVEIELVKETFDKRLAAVKAWAARMELDARQDRITMGIAGRLDSGKAWSTSIPYGYRLNGNIPELIQSKAIGYAGFGNGTLTVFLRGKFDKGFWRVGHRKGPQGISLGRFLGSIRYLEKKFM